MEIRVTSERSNWIFFKRKTIARIVLRGEEFVVESSDRVLDQGVRGLITDLVTAGKLTTEQHHRGVKNGRKFHYSTVVRVDPGHPRFLQCLHKALVTLPETKIGAMKVPWKDAELVN